MHVVSFHERERRLAINLAICSKALCREINSCDFVSRTTPCVYGFEASACYQIKALKMERSLLQRRFVRTYQLAMDEEYAKENLKGSELRKKLVQIRKVRTAAFKNIRVLKNRLKAISSKDRIDSEKLKKLKKGLGGIPG